MKLNKLAYSSLGLLSLFGFLGFITTNKFFFAFFAFAIYFKYFFIQPDEMMEKYMNKSAAYAFYLGCLSLLPVTIICFFILEKNIANSLIIAFAVNWIISIIVYSLLTSYYEYKESKGLEND
ncbi:DUF3796 domain-containing protein [Peptostreptococcus canis]|uniref:DUF3796 domain-containing protein n=1 Tax=Peptostreptococcus canis TaxID=1159213 RepID=A0ABR6TJ65_9FIRM|nr:DUF3796 domain-containing protein [Peptostreptococcus canis]MBC2575273.1 DUF3796 domain-containing protein [Peptostreptococcus canis]MBP1997544.1 hypothetical protein [Peptostreptococcus canis]